MRIFIDIGTFEPDREKMDAIEARTADGEFELVIPPRAKSDETRTYVIKETAERCLDFFVPTVVSGFAVGIWAVWSLFWWSLPIALLGGAAVGYWTYRRADRALDPLHVGWRVESDGRSFHLVRSGPRRSEEALSATLETVGALSSHGVADAVLETYLHDRHCNELKLSTEKGAVLFAEGLDYETCERVVTAFNKYVQRLREEKRIAELQ